MFRTYTNFAYYRFFSTCAELTNYKIKNREGEDSYSILHLIQGKPVDSFRKYTMHHSLNGSFAIRQGDWKLCFCPGSGDWKLVKEFESGKLYLFNLKEDIGEEKNLSSEYPEKTKTLMEKLEKWQKKSWR